MSSPQTHRRNPFFERLRPVEVVLALCCLLVLTGMLLPILRTAVIERDVRAAEASLERIRDAIETFAKDTGCLPARSFNGEENHLFRLAGPGGVAPLSYWSQDARQGFLVDHLLRNTPTGKYAAGYSNWRGPYLEKLEPDPWGKAYMVTLYPGRGGDGRTSVAVSAGPNGCMDSSYASPFGGQAAGDDLLVTIFDG
jgi:type II secretory pathway pseudopilin PulG